jgi:uncharacterized protein (DUF983 family)
MQVTLLVKLRTRWLRCPHCSRGKLVDNTPNPVRICQHCHRAFPDPLSLVWP